MSNSLSLHVNGEGCWPDLTQQSDKLTWLRCDTGNLSIARLPGGMTSGASSVAIRVNTPDGRVVVVEVSMKLFLSVAQVFAAADQADAALAEQSAGRAH